MQAVWIALVVFLVVAAIGLIVGGGALPSSSGFAPDSMYKSH